MKRLRIPAFSAPLPTPAQALENDPGPLLELFYNKVWREQMHDLPFLNPALRVEAVGFSRVQGDWVGVLVTPWFVNLFLLPGGGTLWADIPSGEQRSVEFPAGRLDFIGDNNPEPGATIAAYQYCPLIHPVQHIADQALARQAALDALAALMCPPPEAVAHTGSASDARLSPERNAPVANQAGHVTRELPSPSRRAFLRGGVRKP